ncbi:MAG: sigma-54 dependent transcriptional regulator [Mariprofundaceae bacterium]|nr:sigma-54 dependent transcriptional regulator [Mariprofundaceae bacterium]
MTSRILIVDDEQPICESLAGLFEDEGYLVSTAPSGEEAVARFRKQPVDCIFLDIWMPGIDGLETMQRIKQLDAQVPVIIMSGHATIDTAVRATKLGAFDFIEKPFSSEKLLILLRNALEKRRLAQENTDLKFEHQRDCPLLIGQSKAIEDVKALIEKVAMSDAPALILGEHGTGKSIAARLLHEYSKRKSAAFMSVNVAGIADSHLESEIFGHEKGAFAGALHGQRGRLEAAHQGTLFVDEISGIPLGIQANILQVMQQKRLRRLGNPTPVACDVRIIAASLFEPETLLNDALLREDFYYRLNVLTIKMPSLRDRREDIPLLLDFLAQEQAEHLGGEQVSFDAEVVSLLQAYDWPGNVRELRNYLERCHILCSGQCLNKNSMLPLDASHQETPTYTSVPDDSVLLDGFHDARKRFERSYIFHHLEKNAWNVSKTASDIGMERSQLHRKIKAYGLTVDTA